MDVLIERLLDSGSDPNSPTESQLKTETKIAEHIGGLLEWQIRLRHFQDLEKVLNNTGTQTIA